MIRLKRIYEPAAPADGYRILVDRLWPRGVSKQHAKLDLWLKEVAPTTELRTWFSHDPAKLAEFTRRYLAELEHNPALSELKQVATEHETLTLLYATADPALSHALVLYGLLE